MLALYVLKLDVEVDLELVGLLADDFEGFKALIRHDFITNLLEDLLGCILDDSYQIFILLVLLSSKIRLKVNLEFVLILLDRILQIFDDFPVRLGRLLELILA